MKFTKNRMSKRSTGITDDEAIIPSSKGKPGKSNFHTFFTLDVAVLSKLWWTDLFIIFIEHEGYKADLLIGCFHKSKKIIFLHQMFREKKTD